MPMSRGRADGTLQDSTEGKAVPDPLATMPTTKVHAEVEKDQ